MTKRLRLTLFTLAVSFLSLAAAASVPSAGAILDCNELQDCSGRGVCYEGGDVTGCVMTCVGGGTVTCEPVQN